MKTTISSVIRKGILGIATLAAVVLTAGCSKDKPVTPVVKEKAAIEGSWNLVSYKESGKEVSLPDYFYKDTYAFTGISVDGTTTTGIYNVTSSKADNVVKGGSFSIVAGVYAAKKADGTSVGIKGTITFSSDKKGFTLKDSSTEYAFKKL